MAEPFIGQVMIFAGNFVPQGWAMCNGQLLPINQNVALYSLLGTVYGGDGISTFGLPDLRGRVPVGTGAGAGLQNVVPGQTGGATQATLTADNLPAHTHTLVGNSSAGSQTSPAGASLAQVNTGTAREPQTVLGYVPTAPNAPMAAGSIGTTGSSQAFNTQPPYLGMNYIIALVGIYPPRS